MQHRGSSRAASSMLKSSRSHSGAQRVSSLRGYLRRRSAYRPGKQAC
jgi:hypothetical protein